jgi:8-oxo-dGTP pyrophosphatase MutT (NUDIX family)
VAPAGERLNALALERHALACPGNTQAVAAMLELLGGAGDPFSRQRVVPGHFTASAFVLCPERRRVLLIHHKKLGRWLQPGGHVEPSDVDLAAAAQREVAEETGIVVAAPLGDGIFDVDVHQIPVTPKIGAHRHFDVRFAFLAKSLDVQASDEVLGVRWVELDAARSLTDEDSVLRCVERLRQLKI